MSSQDLFVKDFIALRDGTIQPALLDIGQQLLQQGHDYQIDKGLTLKPPLPMGVTSPYAGVTLEVYPWDVDWKAIEGLRPFNKVPSITFGIDLHARKVNVFVHPNCESSRTIRVGPWVTRTVNSYDLNDVTAEVVLEEVNNFFREIPLDVELN